MATLLKRLSLSLERSSMGPRETGPTGGPSNLQHTSSFNDFSMHVGQEVDSHLDHVESKRPDSRPRDVPRGDRPSPFVVGSAPASGAGLTAGLPPFKSPALKIPRSSVAHILSRVESSTPRSSLDAPASAPSPREGALPSPRSSLEEPASPRSPTTPGGRRRRAQKIDGLDYYEFCELIRSSSL